MFKVTVTLTFKILKLETIQKSTLYDQCLYEKRKSWAKSNLDLYLIDPIIKS